MSLPSDPSDEKYAPGTPMYLHAATTGAKRAVNEWLRRLERGPMYLFEVKGVECALEFSTGHWGLAEGGRWRYGRLDAGDPDEDESGEDLLLDAALGRPPVRGRAGRRHRAKFPPYADGDLTQAEIEARAFVRAEENLRQLVLHPMS